MAPHNVLTCSLPTCEAVLFVGCPRDKNLDLLTPLTFVQICVFKNFGGFAYPCMTPPIEMGMARRAGKEKKQRLWKRRMKEKERGFCELIGVESSSKFYWPRACYVSSPLMPPLLLHFKPRFHWDKTASFSHTCINEFGQNSLMHMCVKVLRK
jgi:hypothetical protein